MKSSTTTPYQNLNKHAYVFIADEDSTTYRPSALFAKQYQLSRERCQNNPHGEI